LNEGSRSRRAQRAGRLHVVQISSSALFGNQTDQRRLCRWSCGHVNAVRSLNPARRSANASERPSCSGSNLHLLLGASPTLSHHRATAVSPCPGWRNRWEAFETFSVAVSPRRLPWPSPGAVCPARPRRR